MAISAQIISHRDATGLAPFSNRISCTEDDEEKPLIALEATCSGRKTDKDIVFRLDLSAKGADLPSIETSISILQRCRKKKCLVYAKRAHLLMCRNGLDSNPVLGNFLVPMFVECGSVIDGKRIFRSLLVRNEHSWTSIIEGYLECQLFIDAVGILQTMQDDHVCPSEYTYVTLLKACSWLQSVDNGRVIHADIVKVGFEVDNFVGNTIIDLYAKCGLIEDATDVFDRLQCRDVVSWNAMMAGYAELGYSNDVLNHLNKMKQEGVFGDALTFLSCLKACSSLRIVENGFNVHHDLVTEGFENDTFLSTALIGMYAKLGLMVEAQELFDELPMRDVMSWTPLITGYADHGHSEQALICIERMFQDGVHVDALTLTSCLKVSASLGNVDSIREIHVRIIMDGFEQESFLGSTLVSVYAKFGLFTDAQDLLKERLNQDVVTWTALMAGYIDQGFPGEALKCYEQMRSEGILPNVATYICTLKACSKLRAMENGKSFHAEVVTKAMEGDLQLGNALVDMYAKCGLLSESWEVFHRLPIHDVVSWNALITGYAENGFGNEVLRCFDRMEVEGTSPNAATFVCSLKDCVDLKEGFQIHAKVAEEGFESYPLLGNSLVDMYAKCGFLLEAQDVFDEFLVKDAVSWTTLISAYADHMLYEEALNCMDRMEMDNISPDSIMLLCNLKACAVLGAIHRGQEIHSEAITRGFENDSFIANTLIDMYVKCNLVTDARAVFDNLCRRDVVSWTSIATGYVGYGVCDKALECLYEMQREGLSPDTIMWSVIIEGYSEKKESEQVLLLFSQMQEQCIAPNVVTFMSILNVCGHCGGLEAAKRVHAQVHCIDEGMREADVAVSLIDMYGRCGSMVEGQHLFEEMVDKDVPSWNAVIAGYARAGSSKAVFRLVHRMMEEGRKPDEITFLNMYTACNHGGLVHAGNACFEAVSKEYGVAPTTEHCNCIIDLFGRAGRFPEALMIFREVSFQPDLVSWVTLLSACRKSGHVEIGQRAFELATEFYNDDGAAYVLMSNVFVDGEE
jgi:pentatricopeptide repeat protein